jgi:hypothetical protein
MYREDHKVVRLFANKKNFFYNRWNLNLRFPGETSDTYLTIDQKFIGVVSTETEIWFFEKSVKNKNNILVAQNTRTIWKFDFLIKKIKFKFKFTIWNFGHFFFKKSYLSLSTDYTYNFLVNGQIGVWSFTWTP